jgi:hypothetical protein
MVRMMEGLNCNIGFNAIDVPANQFCDVDDAPTKKAAWDRIISNVMSDSNGCAFEFSVVTNYSMTNFRYQLRPGMDHVEPLLVTDHNNFIEKKGLTERIIACKRLRSVRIGYIACSNLNDCMRSIRIEYIQRLAAQGITMTTGDIDIAWETTQCDGVEIAMAMIYSPQEKATEVKEKIIAMSPTVEKGTYARTHNHVIYSSRLFDREK